MKVRVLKAGENLSLEDKELGIFKFDHNGRSLRTCITLAQDAALTLLGDVVLVWGDLRVTIGLQDSYNEVLEECEKFLK